MMVMMIIDRNKGLRAPLLQVGCPKRQLKSNASYYHFPSWFDLINMFYFYRKFFIRLNSNQFSRKSNNLVILPLQKICTVLPGHNISFGGRGLSCFISSGRVPHPHQSAVPTPTPSMNFKYPPCKCQDLLLNIGDIWGGGYFSSHYLHAGRNSL